MKFSKLYGLLACILATVGAFSESTIALLEGMVIAVIGVIAAINEVGDNQ